KPVIDWSTAKESNPARFRAYFDAMMQRGVYFAPSAYEAGFVSAAHSDEDIDQTVSAARFAFERMGSLGV
ncbi:MAG TPA: aspartate aminotransferase family protein, partial [Spirochaetia bacterium]|nr:aspartate aminotransferase family protein [Spirochaetia bacterium]